MDSATITAVIAASVSIVSVAANLYIAKSARQSAIDGVRLKAKLDHDEVVDKVIKEIEVEGERLRIKAWELIECSKASGPSLEREKLGASIEGFASQAAEFLDKWAPAKGELPLVMLEVLRVLRHDCRNAIDAVSIFGYRLTSEDEPGTLTSQEFTENLIVLLRKVDNFTSKISKIRRQRLVGAFGTDDPLWRLEK